MAHEMEEAVNAALYGPEKKKHKVYDHEFNVKPIEVQREGDALYVNGQISHCLRWRRDDQVYYRFTKQSDTVTGLEIDINRGGWAPIAGPIAAAVGTYLTGTPIPPEEVIEIGQAIGRVQDGSWEGACKAIIVNVTLRVH
jgi:hypothetical protein